MSQIAADCHHARSNPFASRHIRPGALPFLFQDGCSVVDVVQRLKSQRFRGQIIGPHGSGKSTLLRALANELEGRGHRVTLVQLNNQRRSLPPLSTQPHVVLVDGYEQLSRWSRWRLRSVCRRLGHGLVVTAHTETSLPDLYRTSIDASVAQQVIASLLDNSHIMDPALRATLTHALPDRLRAHSNNLRNVLFELYDVYRGEDRNSRSVTA
jgi:hypothetical protein